MYLALYRKFRPRTFDDVVSQEHITITLQNQVHYQKTAHAYLFTGSRGTGKTTCAKILAMAVNCTNPQNGNPCLECDSCRSILDGSNMDVSEIDAASNNGVDNIRQLREEAFFLPSQSKYRVYIIDETHMLSAGAFNALLKIMEEPPAHVVFILATTEVQKVPATILSRCQRFDFRRIRLEDIVARLGYIALQEGISLEEDAAQTIARLADGGMRDALSLLDQCIAYAPDGTQISAQTVAAAAGVTGRDYLYQIVDFLLENDSAAALEILSNLYGMSKDLQTLCEELVTVFRNVMVLKTGKRAEELVQVLPAELIRLQGYLDRFSLSRLLYSITVLQETLDKMNRFSDKKLSMELSLIRLAIPALDTSKEALLHRIEQLESVVKSGRLKAAPLPCAAASPEPVREVPFLQEQPPELPQQSDLPASDSADQAAPAPTVSSVEDTLHLPVFPSWAQVIAYVQQNDGFIYSLIHNTKAYVQGDCIYLVSPFANLREMLKKDRCATRLGNAIEAVAGKRYKLRLSKGVSVEKEQTIDPLDSFKFKMEEAGIPFQIKDENTQV